MDERVKKVFYYLGIVAALYLFFYYILPLIIKFLAFVFKAVFFIFMWAAVAVVVILLVAHIVKMVRKEI